MRARKRSSRRNEVSVPSFYPDPLGFIFLFGVVTRRNLVHCWECAIPVLLRGILHSILLQTVTNQFANPRQRCCGFAYR